MGDGGDCRNRKNRAGAPKRPAVAPAPRGGAPEGAKKKGRGGQSKNKMKFWAGATKNRRPRTRAGGFLGGGPGGIFKIFLRNRGETPAPF